MARWLRFFSERFPVPLLAVITGGFALSSLASTGLVFRGSTALLGWLQAFLMFGVLRLMDEVKDYKKDLIAHPERPLPRGLLTLEEARRGIGFGLLLMSALAALSLIVFTRESGLLYAATALFLYGMYREFGIGNWLEPRPLLYAISHQGISVLLSASIASLAFVSHEAVSPRAWLQASLLLLGAFFTYEVARKLDPHAHPLLRTYRSVHGDLKTGFILMGTTLVSLLGSWILFADQVWLWIFWGIELSVLFSYGLLIHKNHKITEALASVSLLLHLWGPAIFYFVRP
jgi:hypothetical protein